VVSAKGSTPSVRHETAALRDFNPGYVAFGSDSVIRRCPLNVRITPASGPQRLITGMSHECRTHAPQQNVKALNSRSEPVERAENAECPLAALSKRTSPPPRSTPREAGNSGR